MTKKRIQQLVEELDAINGQDPEKAHGDADTVLLKAVPKEIQDAYARLVARCPWWN